MQEQVLAYPHIQSVEIVEEEDEEKRFLSKRATDNAGVQVVRAWDTPKPIRIRHYGLAGLTREEFDNPAARFEMRSSPTPMPRSAQEVAQESLLDISVPRDQPIPIQDLQALVEERRGLGWVAEPAPSSQDYPAHPMQYLGTQSPPGETSSYLAAPALPGGSPIVPAFPLGSPRRPGHHQEFQRANSATPLRFE